MADIQKQQNLTIPDNSKIDIGHNAFNTEGNAKETSAWVKQNDIKSIRLVTSNYHINRSIIEFYKQDPNLTIVAHPVYSEKIEKKWWTSWQTFSLISKEYNKFLYIYLTQKLQED